MQTKDAQTWWHMRINQLALEAKENFPDDARIPMLTQQALHNNTRAFDTLYWLSKGVKEPLV